MLGQQLGLLEDGIAGGGVDEQRREAGQGCVQRVEQRVVGGLAGQVGLGEAGSSWSLAEATPTSSGALCLRYDLIRPAAGR